MAAPQTAARAIFEKLGFCIDAMLPNHVKDSEGHLHPLVVMSCGLDDVAKSLREFYNDADWPDG